MSLFFVFWQNWVHQSLPTCSALVKLWIRVLIHSNLWILMVHLDQLPEKERNILFQQRMWPTQGLGCPDSRDLPDPYNYQTLVQPSFRRAKDSDWLEYEFNCKPGRVDRLPCLISPYHYRLDWLMWFAAFQDKATTELRSQFLAARPDDAISRTSCGSLFRIQDRILGFLPFWIDY